MLLLKSGGKRGEGQNERRNERGVGEERRNETGAEEERGVTWRCSRMREGTRFTHTHT